MPRRPFRTSGRLAMVAAVLVGVALLAAGTTIWQPWTADDPDASGTVQTAWGPLTAAERDLLVKVRLTCLWEVSTAQQAQQQASSPAVKEVTDKILVEHTGLDEKVLDIAGKLGVPLPSSPDAQQVAWTQEITAAAGSGYDRIVIQRLREADGNVLPVAQRVRVSTGNDLIRAFSRDTLIQVMRHVGYLEGTGLVDYTALPETPSPGTSAVVSNWRQLIVPGLVLLACLLAALWLGSTLAGRRRSDRPDESSGGILGQLAGRGAERALQPVAQHRTAPDQDDVDEPGDDRHTLAR